MEHIMAKKAEINKSQSVRDLIREHSGISNKEIVEAMKKQGVAISANHVANIRSKMALSKGKRKRRGKAAKAVAAKTGIDILEIKAAFALLKHCGGLQGANAALKAAVEIQKIM
jgi:arginine repressor